jgi:hypothetical protein
MGAQWTIRLIPRRYETTVPNPISDAISLENALSDRRTCFPTSSVRKMVVLRTVRGKIVKSHDRSEIGAPDSDLS